MVGGRSFRIDRYMRLLLSRGADPWQLSVFCLLRERGSPDQIGPTTVESLAVQQFQKLLPAQIRAKNALHLNLERMVMPAIAILLVLFATYSPNTAVGAH